MQRIIGRRKKQGIMKGQKAVITRRQVREQQSLIIHRPTLEQQQKHYSLWYQTPEMGLEGLVATIRSKKKLQTALASELMKKRARTSQ
jgi:hypothetical protein